jgi:hypothetical protein
MRRDEVVGVQFAERRDDCSARVGMGRERPQDGCLRPPKLRAIYQGDVVAYVHGARDLRNFTGHAPDLFQHVDQLTGHDSRTAGVTRLGNGCHVAHEHCADRPEVVEHAGALAGGRLREVRKLCGSDQVRRFQFVADVGSPMTVQTISADLEFLGEGVERCAASA